jgi:hypothetical protein
MLAENDNGYGARQADFRPPLTVYRFGRANGQMTLVRVVFDPSRGGSQFLLRAAQPHPGCPAFQEEGAGPRPAAVPKRPRPDFLTIVK